MSNNIVYVVTMQRWGDNETHHYVIGTYTTKETAEYIGNVEKSWRGGKYEPNITECELDSIISEEKINFHIKCGF